MPTLPAPRPATRQPRRPQQRRVPRRHRARGPVNPATIRPGQRLKLRLKVPQPKPKPLGPRLHTVRTGETYGSIAAQMGHSVTRLQRLNPKLKATELRPGGRVCLRK